MSKIVSNLFISLDGVVESPDQWHFPYFDEQMGAALGRATQSTSAYLMGRVLYEQWSADWPGKTNDPFASFINSVPKYVVSNSLRTADWDNTTIVSGDVATRLREIKSQTQGDIGMSGSATLVRWLLAHDLLDELHLLIDPVVVGDGQRLFEDSPKRPLKLVEHEVFKTGVLNLTYTPASD